MATAASVTSSPSTNDEIKAPTKTARQIATEMMLSGHLKSYAAVCPDCGPDAEVLTGPFVEFAL